MQIFDVTRQVLIWKQENAGSYVTWSPDGDRLAGIIAEGSKTVLHSTEIGVFPIIWPRLHGIRIWNLRTNVVDQTVEITDDAARLTSINWLTTDLIGSTYRYRTEIATGFGVGVWNLSSGKRVFSDSIGFGSSSGGSVVWSPDGRFTAAETIWRIAWTNIFSTASEDYDVNIEGTNPAWTPDSRYVTVIKEDERRTLLHYDIVTDTTVEYPLNQTAS